VQRHVPGTSPGRAGYANRPWPLLREVGDTRGLAEVLVGVATQALHAGAYARGEVLGGEALALFRAMGDTGRIELQVVLHPSPVARRFS
jgi:hypothetical protein